MGLSDAVGNLLQKVYAPSYLYFSRRCGLCIRVHELLDSSLHITNGARQGRRHRSVFKKSRAWERYWAHALSALPAQNALLWGPGCQVPT